MFGVGENKTPAAFRNACDDFILTEVPQLDDEEKTTGTKGTKGTKKKPAKKTNKQLSQDSKLINTLRSAVDEYADDDGWALLSACGSLIKRQHPGFDPRSYGYRTFALLFEATGLFDIDRRTSGAVPTVFVKDKKR